MLEPVKIISPDALLGEAAFLKATGHRLVTISCVNINPEEVDLLYHFDKDLSLCHLRLTLQRKAPVPSLSSLYMSAFLVENEIQDLFDIRFQGLIIDYDRTLYLSPDIRTTPFCSYRAVPAKKAKKTANAPPEVSP
jgi:ech hydrogenase subunit D